MAVLVDRKLTVYQVPVAASRSHFNGSLYDGELVNCNGSHVFLVFDAVAHRGRYVGDENFLSRVAIIRSVFDLEGATAKCPEEAAQLAKRGKVICGGSANGLCFRPKQCFQIRQLDTLLRQIPLLPYAVDGLILTPVDDPVRTGTHDTIFKFKLQHSIDVEVSADGSTLMVGMGGAPATAVLRVPLESLGIPMRMSPELSRELPALAGKIVELRLSFDETDGAVFLSLLTLRRDKVHPNAAATILRTIVNVKENITEKELLELAHAAAERQDLRKGQTSVLSLASTEGASPGAT
jgi:hypothetical protein